MASIRPGPNGHQGGPPPPPQGYGSLPPSQSRSNGYPMNPMPPNAPPPGAASPNYPTASTMKQLNELNVSVWMEIGRISESMEDFERAKIAYETAVKHNHDSIAAKKALALLYKDKFKMYDKAIEYLNSCIHQMHDPVDLHAILGHCFLMSGDLPKAYTAYQNSLAIPANVAQDPDVWYGIGLLYDRYASFDHAEEAFSNVLYIDPNYRKRSEIYFRLGIIYKQQKKFSQSIACFEYILAQPPEPLTPANIWTQIGYVHQVANNFPKAREAFETVLQDEPENPKVLLQLGYIHSIPNSSIRDLDRANMYIDRALAADSKDPQAWYYLGRYYMQRLNYGKAYEAYQQAVYRDSRNSNFWCSIGVLYWEINQYRDALDAYTRAIRLNPYIPEIWFNLGTLYEACNNQIQDAIDAYNRAYELDNSYNIVEDRLRILKRNLETGSVEGPSPPRPSDIDPQRYDDFVQNQANQQSAAQLQGIMVQQNSWGPPGSGPPTSQHRPMHQGPPPQHAQYPPRRSPDQLKSVPPPYSHPPPSSYPNGSGYGRSGGPPIKRGSSPPPSSYGYDARPPMGEPPQHQGYPRHDDMPHRVPHIPPSQSYVSPREHDRDIGGGYPPPASRSPISYSHRRSPPAPGPISQHGPPPDVKPIVDQGPSPISPNNSHNVQLAPLQSIRSPQPNPIPPVPRNDAPAYPPPGQDPIPKRAWESEREYPRGDSSRSSPRSRDEVRRTSAERPPDRRPSPPPVKSHDPTPRPRSPLISPRTTEPSYIPPERKSPPISSSRMEVDSPHEKIERRSASREEVEKMHIEEDKRPEAEAPARQMDIDEDYDKEEEKPEEK